MPLRIRFSLIALAVCWPSLVLAQVYQSPVKIAWNPSLNATGYEITVDGVTTDVGPATVSSPITLSPGPHAATAIAYNANRVESPPSSPPFTFQVGPLTTACTQRPQIVVTSYSPTLAVGARGHVAFTLFNSLPIVTIQARLGTQVVGQLVVSDARDVEGLGFSMPRTPATYHLVLSAIDTAGCETVTTADRPIVVN